MLSIIHNIFKSCLAVPNLLFVHYVGEMFCDIIYCMRPFISSHLWISTSPPFSRVYINIEVPDSRAVSVNGSRAFDKCTIWICHYCYAFSFISENGFESGYMEMYTLIYTKHLTDCYKECINNIADHINYIAIVFYPFNLLWQITEVTGN